MENREEKEIDKGSKTDINVILAGINEIVNVLDETGQGNFDIKVSDEIVKSSNSQLALLASKINQNIQTVKEQHVRVKEYHDSTMVTN